GRSSTRRASSRSIPRTGPSSRGPDLPRGRADGRRVARGRPLGLSRELGPLPGREADAGTPGSRRGRLPHAAERDLVRGAQGAELARAVRLDAELEARIAPGQQVDVAHRLLLEAQGERGEVADAARHAPEDDRREPAEDGEQL